MSAFFVVKSPIIPVYPLDLGAPYCPSLGFLRVYVKFMDSFICDYIITLCKNNTILLATFFLHT